MHDLGKLVLGCNFPDRYAEVMKQPDPASARDAEAREFGANHPAVGAYLLWLWGLPEAVTEIVACHHLDIEREEIVTPVMAVYLADTLLQGGTELETARNHSERLGLTKFFPKWENLAVELSSEDK